MVHFPATVEQFLALSFKTDFVPSTERETTIPCFANKAWISKAFPRLSVVNKSTSSFRGSLDTSISLLLD